MNNNCQGNENGGTRWESDVNPQIPEDQVSPPIRIKVTKVVIAHQPNARLAESKCGMVTTLVPTLKVVAAHGVLGKFG